MTKGKAERSKAEIRQSSRGVNRLNRKERDISEAKKTGMESKVKEMAKGKGIA